MNGTKKHRVVILGGGFGGLKAAQSLAKTDVDVTLIDRRNFHLFQPLLYQVATGALSGGEIASPIRSILSRQKNARVLLAEAIDLDADGRRLITDAGAIEYDTLIVATGVRNCYFGHEEWDRAAPGLKTLEEAAQIRQKVLFAFEAAERENNPDKRAEWLTFVVVGAGPTGVELAGALGEIARQTLREDFRTIRPEEAQILLLDSASRVLPHFHASLSENAEKALLRLGVRARLKVRVTNISESGVTTATENGEIFIPTHCAIWAAGVKASPFADALARRAGASLELDGRVIVQPDCSLQTHPEIFAIGDIASFGYDGHQLPGVAQVAMQQAKYVAGVIGKRLRGERETRRFYYFDKGQMAVIGRGKAVAEAGWLRLQGVTAWLGWLFIHLLYIAESSNRLLVLVRWFYLYTSFNRGARLITGNDHLLVEKALPDESEIEAAALPD
ncbi:MAG TPA: NAD(P)/FAD-dependent oxidoreductase [Bryobacteraceae bacterium]|jgi:NADH dehydrogenase|nr:NAD(P)/FAD-dependent oxidoreductase [Bryobacteraceae bacterium]